MNQEVRRLDREEDQPSVSVSRPAKTRARTTTLGEVKLKYVSLNDLVRFVELIDEAEDDRLYVARVLHHQLTAPTVSFAEFNAMPDEELTELARQFVRKETDLFSYFTPTSDVAFFGDFRNAIQKGSQRFVADLAASLHAALGPTLEAALGPTLEAIFTAIRESIEPALKEWTTFWHRFREQYEVAEDEAIDVLRQYKWLVTPSLPVSLVFEAARIGTRAGNRRKEMNRLFVGYFSSNSFANLGALVDGWCENAIFEPRLKIFRDCLQALRHAGRGYNPSNVVVPTLIAQIDGIQTEFMRRQGLTFDRKSRNWRAQNGTTVDKEGWLRRYTSGQKLLDVAADLFLDVLFQRAWPGEPLQTPFTFSRHKIMHGEQVKYGRIDNSIRAFLALDLLAWLTRGPRSRGAGATDTVG
jgi:hypothetical protein